MPPPWLWQCRHASRVVAGPQAVPLASMPCKDMEARGTAMADMPCCRQHAGIPAAHARPHGPALTDPACHPTLTELTALPIAQLNPERHRQHLAASVTYAALTTSPTLPHLTPPELRRPPPLLDLPAPLRLRTPAPRAPPLA